MHQIHYIWIKPIISNTTSNTNFASVNRCYRQEEVRSRDNTGLLGMKSSIISVKQAGQCLFLGSSNRENHGRRNGPWQINKVYAAVCHNCGALRISTCEWTDLESERWPEPMEESQGCSISVRFLSSVSAFLNWAPNFWIMSIITLFGSPWGNAQGVIVWCWFVKVNGFPSFSKIVSINAHTG